MTKEKEILIETELDENGYIKISKDKANEIKKEIQKYITDIKVKEVLPIPSQNAISVCYIPSVSVEEEAIIATMEIEDED